MKHEPGFFLDKNYAPRGMFTKNAVQFWAIPRSDLLSRKKTEEKGENLKKNEKKRIFDMKNEFFLILK